MLAGYADEHVKFAIVEGLRRRGMDVVTVQDRALQQAEDEILLETATREGRPLLTNDVDFLRIHDCWMGSKPRSGRYAKKSGSQAPQIKNSRNIITDKRVRMNVMANSEK